MSKETETLAEFAASLSYSDIPAAALAAAKLVIIDALAVGFFGADLPWSRRVHATALQGSPQGNAFLLDMAMTATSARTAALVNGVFIHSFEFDNLRYPNAGVHAGSTVWPAAMAVAAERSASGADTLAALVAGCEVAFRIGVSGRGSFEKVGFHAPGITGVFGAVAAAGRLMRLDPPRMAQAFGIAGSLCGGLLAFSAAGNGGAVKPLHMGRAAEAGVFAAQLAADGYEGPSGILEGKFGVLQAFARDADVSGLTAGLGTSWEIQNVCFKKYSCHIMAQTVVEGLRDLVTANQVDPRSVEAIELGVSEKVLSHHANREPNDIGTSQYSVPMCAAIALFRDPADPRSFLADPHADQDIRAIARKVALVHQPETEKPGMTLATRITLRLISGRTLETSKSEFQGMRMNSATDLVFEKFDRLAGPRIHQAPALRRTLDTFDSIAAFGRSALLQGSGSRATAT